MEELRHLDMFDSVRAAPPDPTGAAVAVREDNVPLDCGEHPGLGKEHNMLTACLHDIVVALSSSPEASPGSATLPEAVLISRHRHRNPLTLRMLRAHMLQSVHMLLRLAGNPSGECHCLLMNA